MKMKGVKKLSHFFPNTPCMSVLLLFSCISLTVTLLKAMNEIDTYMCDPPFSMTSLSQNALEKLRIAIDFKLTYIGIA